MNEQQIGRMFEDEAEVFLRQEGYEDVERAIDYGSAYDLTAIKEGLKHRVEVKGRRKSAKTHFFTVRRNKLNRLRQLENVLFMFINQYEGYQIIPMNELENHIKPININGNKVYIINKENPQRRNIRWGVRRIQLTVDEDVFDRLKELKGDRSWEKFLVEAGLKYVKAEEAEG